MTSTFWDRYAAIGYDALRVLAPYEALQHAVVDAAALQPGERLMVAGCGTGNLEWLAAQQVADLRVDAVDFSPAMLARARAKCAAWPGVRHHQADLCADFSLPAPDVVVMCNVLYALHDQVAALRAVHRVLRPGGRFVLCDRHPWSTIRPVVGAHLAALRMLPPAARARRWAQTLAAAPRLALVTAANLAIQRRHQAGAYHFFALSDIRTLLTTLGFTVTAEDLVYANQCWLVCAIRGPDEAEHAP